MLRDRQKLLRMRRLEREEEAAQAARKLPPARGLIGRMLHGEDIAFSRWRFDGRWVAMFAILSLVGGGLAFWWSQSRDFYHVIQTNTLEIAGNGYQVNGFSGVDSSTAPGMLFACFQVEGQVLAPVIAEVAPPDAPAWLRCFKAGFIRHEVHSGSGRAYLAEYNDKPGYDRIVAVTTGGRAYMWRQPNGNPTE